MSKERVTGLAAPANVPLNNGSSSLAVGNHYNSGFSNSSGIIKEMWTEGDRVFILLESGARLVMFSSGMLLELEPAPPSKKAQPAA